MGIHFAHTQSEELHFLNPVSQQQTGAVAFVRVIPLHCAAGRRCRPLTKREGGRAAVPLPHTAVALLCRLIVIRVSSALRPGAELRTRDSCDAPLLAPADGAAEAT